SIDSVEFGQTSRVRSLLLSGLSRVRSGLRLSREHERSRVRPLPLVPNDERSRVRPLPLVHRSRLYTVYRNGPIPPRNGNFLGRFRGVLTVFVDAEGSSAACQDH